MKFVQLSSTYYSDRLSFVIYSKETINGRTKRSNSYISFKEIINLRLEVIYE